MRSAGKGLFLPAEEASRSLFLRLLFLSRRPPSRSHPPDPLAAYRSAQVPLLRSQVMRARRRHEPAIRSLFPVEGQDPVSHGQPTHGSCPGQGRRRYGLCGAVVDSGRDGGPVLARRGGQGAPKRSGCQTSALIVIGMRLPVWSSPRRRPEGNSMGLTLLLGAMGHFLFSPPVYLLPPHPSPLPPRLRPRRRSPACEEVYGSDLPLPSTLPLCSTRDINQTHDNDDSPKMSEFLQRQPRTRGLP